MRPIEVAQRWPPDEVSAWIGERHVFGASSRKGRLESPARDPKAHPGPHATKTWSAPHTLTATPVGRHSRGGASGYSCYTLTAMRRGCNVSHTPGAASGPVHDLCVTRRRSVTTFEAMDVGGGQLRRALRVRHLVMLSVGGTIASGFLLFAGSAIGIAGPAVIV